VVGGASGLWLALLGLALGATVPPVAGAAAAGPEAGDDLLEFLEFLGDEDTASDVWNGFFDSLPERPEDAVPLTTAPSPAQEKTP